MLTVCVLNDGCWLAAAGQSVEVLRSASFTLLGIDAFLGQLCQVHHHRKSFLAHVIPQPLVGVTLSSSLVADRRLQLSSPQSVCSCLSFPCGHVESNCSTKKKKKTFVPIVHLLKFKQLDLLLALAEQTVTICCTLVGLQYLF